MRRLGPVLVVLVAVSVVAAGACSGGGSAKTGRGRSFADATCADLAAWAAAVQPVFADLQALASLDGSDKAAARTQLAKLSTELRTAIEATSRLSGGIASRPAPDIASGDSVKQTLVESLDRLRDVGTQAKATVDAFDVDTATPEQSTEFKTAIGEAVNSVASSLAAVTPLLSNNDELRSAFTGSQTCKNAGSQFSSGNN